MKAQAMVTGLIGKVPRAVSSNVAIGSAAVFGLCAVVLSFTLDPRVRDSADGLVQAGLGLRGTITPQDQPYRNAPSPLGPVNAPIMARL